LLFISTNCSPPRPEARFIPGAANICVAYLIRPFRSSDAEKLSEITLAAIRTLGPDCYSSQQVEAWASKHEGSAMYRRRIAQGAAIIVAADTQDEPVGYALLEPDGHLDRLFNHPDHIRQGLAVQLLVHAEQHARANRVSHLYTEASELARPAFERAGYDLIERRDFVIEYAGRQVPIHNYAMEKTLD